MHARACRRPVAASNDWIIAESVVQHETAVGRPETGQRMADPRRALVNGVSGPVRTVPVTGSKISLSAEPFPSFPTTRTRPSGSRVAAVRRVSEDRRTGRDVRPVAGSKISAEPRASGPPIRVVAADDEDPPVVESDQQRVRRAWRRLDAGWTAGRPGRSRWPRRPRRRPADRTPRTPPAPTPSAGSGHRPGAGRGGVVGPDRVGPGANVPLTGSKTSVERGSPRSFVRHRRGPDRRAAGSRCGRTAP